MARAPRQPLQEPQSRIRVWTVPVSCPSQQRIPAPSSPLQWRQSLPRTHCHGCRWAARVDATRLLPPRMPTHPFLALPSAPLLSKSKPLAAFPLLLPLFPSHPPASSSIQEEMRSLQRDSADSRLLQDRLWIFLSSHYLPPSLPPPNHFAVPQQSSRFLMQNLLTV